jgi:hypothetical protein
LRGQEEIMDKIFHSLSDIFMFIALWIGVPVSLFSMLLLLGFQIKNRFSIGITIVGICGIACFGLGINFQGIVTGEALSLSKFGPCTVSKTNDPHYYWLAISTWLAGSSALICMGIWALIRLFIKNNLPIKKDYP